MKKTLEKEPVEMSAPCRLDFGGTLDISTFYLPLKHYSPSTFNLAINMRTHVRLLPYRPGWVKVSSRGFDSVEFESQKLQFSNPLGLMFAVASYFGADGVHIDIDSSSPPRSALGGSSVAAVALVAAFIEASKEGQHSIPLDRVVLLAHAIESSVARVPCGMQDQLAAAYGGVHSWCWNGEVETLPYTKKRVVEKNNYGVLEDHIIAAYCGEPHESKNINGKWVQEFLEGKNFMIWKEIIECCNSFSEAIASENYGRAAELMRRETELRVEMTPDVLDDVGIKLADSARLNNCGARFTGAGGGGCIWAVGEKDNLVTLKDHWAAIIGSHEHAHFLDVGIDGTGLKKEIIK